MLRRDPPLHPKNNERQSLTELRVICAIRQSEKPIRQPRGLIHPDSLELVTKGRNNVIKMDDHEISQPEHSDYYIQRPHVTYVGSITFIC
jgi:hypothetical protein